MSFIYKNPLTSTQIGGENSVARDDYFGTNFSVLQVGGYMEVYYLSDLDYTVPAGDTGPIKFSGNTIPINFTKKTLAFLPDTITLNSDNISSGRRRLGMLVYVHETERTYQYTMDNFETLWVAVSGSAAQSDYGTTIQSNVAGGQNFIDAWLDSSIEGVSGVTRSNARWKIFYGTDITVTGGTYDNSTGTATFTNTTGGTFNVTGFTTGGTGTDTFLTGGTYNKSTGDLDLNQNDGKTVTVTGITDTNIANTNLTLDQSRILSLNGNDFDIIGGSGERLSLSSTDLILSASTAGTISFKGINTSSQSNYLVIDGNGNLSYTTIPTSITGITYDDNWGITKEYSDGTSGTTLLPFITGGTYVGGEINLNTALGDSISISAPETSDTYVTGGTYNNSTGTLTLERNDNNTINISGFVTGTTEDTYVTGITYNQLTKTLTVGLNDGVDFTATGFSPTITGGTYNNGQISLGNNDGTSTTIGGLEILTHIGYTASTTVSVSGQTIDTVDATTYQGAFFDYVINDGTNYRAGTVQSVWDGTTIKYNDFSTVDIGTTNNFVWGMELSGGDALLNANIAGGTWNIRIIKHII